MSDIILLLLLIRIFYVLGLLNELHQDYRIIIHV